MNCKRFKPVPGTVYTNHGGGTFLCGDIWENDTPVLSYCASMTNTNSGWTFIANGLVQYEDGTIEWDYSTGGHFRMLCGDQYCPFWRSDDGGVCKGWPGENSHPCQANKDGTGCPLFG